VDDAAFERLWPLTEGRRIEKVRYLVPAEAPGLVIEVDVYDGALAGLVVAEVEFAGEADAEAFVPPAWLGREVTGDARFKNQRLAVDGPPVPRPDD
jgi:adenylate cyclase